MRFASTAITGKPSNIPLGAASEPHASALAESECHRSGMTGSMVIDAEVARGRSYRQWESGVVGDVVRLGDGQGRVGLGQQGVTGHQPAERDLSG